MIWMFKYVFMESKLRRIGVPTRGSSSRRLSFEHVTLLDQIICTRIQTTFEIIRAFKTKIGMNTTPNKLNHINKTLNRKKLWYLSQIVVKS